MQTAGHWHWAMLLRKMVSGWESAGSLPGSDFLAEQQQVYKLITSNFP